MSDFSQALRRISCQHLQGVGHQRGGDVPLNATKAPRGTSVRRSARVHVWDVLPLHLGPLWETSKLEQRQLLDDPQLLHPSWMAEGRASSQIQHPSQAAGV